LKSKSRICLFAALLVLVFLLTSPKSAVESSFSYYNDHESSMGNKVSVWTSSLWQQTTKEDFEAGALNQVDVTTASGDVILETTTYEEQRLVSYDNSSSNSTTVESSEQVASSSSVETTLYALQDSFLDSTSPQATDGDSTVLYVYGKGNNIQRGIIMFDMPTLGSDAKITSATLYLNKHPFGEGSSLLGMHRVVNAWTESNVSWVSRGNEGDWDTAGGDFLFEPSSVQQVSASQGQSWVGWDVTNDLTYFLLNPGENFGWIIKDEEETATVGAEWAFSSKESLESERPRLVVVYETASEENKTTPTNEFPAESTSTVELTSFTGYVTQGTITSTVFDTGRNAAHFDAVFWDSYVPSETSITFAVRASDEFFEIGSSSPAWTYIGSDSGVSTGMSTGRYMQWTATLTTNDTSTSPVISEVRVYYH